MFEPNIQDENRDYSISELSEEFAVTPRAIRFYEDQGLLSPARKGQRRIYRERDRVRLRLILRGKRLGFPLSEIKEIFDLYDDEPGEKGQLRYLIERIQERRVRLEQQQNDIKVVLRDMVDVEMRARRALEELN
ncbi:MAG: MerR family DNA-binding transcriptional regulator [Gammaproteobacteria bacterium]|nr:MerR family DNA-binding transcriptional regulator [Gammaproteobacteria bacterium]